MGSACTGARRVPGLSGSDHGASNCQGEKPLFINHAYESATNYAEIVAGNAPKNDNLWCASRDDWRRGGDSDLPVSVAFQPIDSQAFARRVRITVYHHGVPRGRYEGRTQWHGLVTFEHDHRPGMTVMPLGIFGSERSRGSVRTERLRHVASSEDLASTEQTGASSGPGTSAHPPAAAWQRSRWV